MLSQKILLCVLILFFCAAVSFAEEEKIFGNISNPVYVDNVDAETVTFKLSSLHPISGEKIDIKINGIDTPEIDGKCEQEKVLAMRAKKQVAHLLRFAQMIQLNNVRQEKGFPVVADFFVDGISLKGLLIANNLAEESEPGAKKKEWCPPDQASNVSGAL
ncbi:MAG: thermonuclease family protein [Nitrospinota bacterium]